MMISYVFSIKMEEYMESFWHFVSKMGCQKYSAWVLGDPFYAYDG